MSTKSDLVRELKAADRLINKLGRLARYYAGPHTADKGNGRWQFPKTTRRRERRAVLEAAGVKFRGR